MRNAQVRRAGRTVTYDLQVALDVAFTQLVAAGDREPGQRADDVHQLAAAAEPHALLARARRRRRDDERVGGHADVPDSGRADADARAVAVTRPPQPGGSCASNNGQAIVACISAKYPDKRAPVGSLGQRQANMEFLRDRIIEAGKCGGLDLGWNLKRGGPEISIDFLAWRRSDGDGHRPRLRLRQHRHDAAAHWGEVDLFASWTRYTNPYTCGS